jgi:hypothetical protein
MMRYKIGKAFQAFGLFVVLVGLSMSMGDFTSGLDSMWAELIGLLGGMALFAVGFLLVGGAGGGD